MNGKHIVISMRKAKHYVNDLFEPDKFYPCSEKLFDDTVVKYREQFKLTYLRGGVQLFEDVNSNIKFKRSWL